MNTDNESGLVSIIMPNYNGAKYLRETIESVIKQTYSNWEIIFVDDCSIDESLDVIKKFGDERIKIYKNDINRGAAYSRNYAVQQAKGRWIAYLDSDDLWTDKKLEKQIEFMIYNNYKFSCSKYQEIDDNGSVLSVISAPLKITRSKLLCWDWIGCLTVMYDARAIGKVETSVERKERDDYAVLLQIAKRADCYFLDELLASYRIHTNSLSHSGKFSLLLQDYKMYRCSEKFSHLKSFFYTTVNFFCWIYKRLYYRKSIKIQYND